MGILEQKKTSVLLLMAVYLFVVLTHILLLPNHHQVSSKSQSRYNSIFKRKLENTSAQALIMMHRTDKSVLNKDQNVQGLFVRLAASFLILLLLPGTARQLRQTIPIRRYFSPFPSFRLSLRI